MSQLLSSLKTRSPIIKCLTRLDQSQTRAMSETMREKCWGKDDVIKCKPPPLECKPPDCCIDIDPPPIGYYCLGYCKAKEVPPLTKCPTDCDRCPEKCCLPFVSKFKIKPCCKPPYDCIEHPEVLCPADPCHVDKCTIQKLSADPCLNPCRKEGDPNSMYELSPKHPCCLPDPCAKDKPQQKPKTPCLSNDCYDPSLKGSAQPCCEKPGYFDPCLTDEKRDLRTLPLDHPCCDCRKPGCGCYYKSNH